MQNTDFIKKIQEWRNASLSDDFADQLNTLKNDALEKINDLSSEASASYYSSNNQGERAFGALTDALKEQFTSFDGLINDVLAKLSKQVHSQTVSDADIERFQDFTHKSHDELTRNIKESFSQFSSFLENHPSNLTQGAHQDAKQFFGDLQNRILEKTDSFAFKLGKDIKSEFEKSEPTKRAEKLAQKWSDKFSKSTPTPTQSWVRAIKSQASNQTERTR